MQMVRNRASKYRMTPLGYEDACGEGYLSLVESAITYDDSRGVPFAAYACQNFCWAMTAAHRGAGHRKRRMVAATEVATDPWFFDKIEERDGLASALIDVAASTKRLSLQQVAVMAMALYGYRSREIAEVLRVSPSRISLLFKEIREAVLAA